MITVQKDDICMEIDERVLSEHERLGWRKVDELPENDTVPLADYQALQAQLDAAQAEITHYERHDKQQETIIARLEDELEAAKQRIAELEAVQANPKGKKAASAE